MSPLAPLLFPLRFRWPLSLRVGLLSGLAAWAFGLGVSFCAPAVLHYVAPDVSHATIQALQHVLFAGVLVPAVFSGLFGFIMTRRLSRRVAAVAPGVRSRVDWAGPEEADQAGGSAAAVPDHADLYQQLSENAQRYRSLFDFTPSAVFTLDRQGRFTEVNPACETLSGYSRHELLTMDFAQLVVPERLATARGHLAATMRGQVQSGETVITRHDGTRVDVEYMGGPILVDDNVVGCFVIASDITERNAAAELVRRTKEAAEAANRAKDRFLAVLSHELRTPLTPVIATLDYLTSDAGFPAHLRSDVEVIRRNVQLETRLIDDLLDVTRISKGKIVLQHAPVDLHLLLRDTVVICQQDLAAKSLHLAFDLQAAQATVHADGARLQQVLWNLLKNALKFTPVGGTITLRTSNCGGPPVGTPGHANGHGPRSQAPGQAESWVCVEVVDTGIGITPENLPRIFNAFEQGEPTVTREYGGLGLGLAISKALIDLHQGTLTASSAGRGHGATFAVHLATTTRPAAMPALRPARPLGGRIEAPPTPGATLTILLVDDHRDTINVLSRLLRAHGHRVTTAESVQAALRAAATQSFDLVISDIGLPDGTGDELMRQLKARYQLRGIALSGYGMEEDVKRSLDAGFFAHLVKPFDFPALQSLLQQTSN